jgi:hypothetical protein
MSKILATSVVQQPQTAWFLVLQERTNLCCAQLAKDKLCSW